MTVPPDVAVLEHLQHGPGVARIRNEVGVHHIEEAPFDKIRDVTVPVLCEPGLPSGLRGPWPEEGHHLFSNGFRLASSVPSSEKSLNAAKCASDCTAARGFYDFPGVVKFLVEKVAPHDRKPVKICLRAEIFLLQASSFKITENLFPYGFGFSEDHGIGMLQGLLRQSGDMKPT